MSTVQKHEFQAEVQQLLDLMVHSLYSNKDIFLRELISNASDALDRLRFESLTRKDILPEEDLAIDLAIDAEARTLTVSDNGIGLTHDETVHNLGTIARSGTQEFLQALNAAKAEGVPPELIGQFGVGFYSSFMVADAVTVVTRKAGEESATRWSSAGGGSYEVEAAERAAAGTTITLKLKDADTEDGRHDYASHGVVRGIVKRYSDFVAYPIRLAPPPAAADADDGEEGGDEAPAKPEVLNSMKAIWTRPEAEVSDEERAEFYKHVSHDWNEPLDSLSATIEGTIEAKALLFIPSTAPFDLHYREQTSRGVHLYVRRVFIMDDCRELLPDYLRFVRGVVDAEDLSLNVSREILQQDRQVRAISKFLVRKVLDRLKGMATDDPEKYEKFWAEFGTVIKEGLAGLSDKKDRLLELLRLHSSHDEEKMTSLAEYVERMPEGQEAIYYVTAASREAAARSPHLEAFREKGYEILYLVDPIDELWAGHAPAFEEKEFRSVGKGEVDLGASDDAEEAQADKKEKQERYESLLAALTGHLEDEVAEVRLSGRLSASPACLVGKEDDLSPMVEEMLKRAGKDVPTTKRILEVNPTHPLLEGLEAKFAKDAEDPAIARHARLLHGQALLAEGRTPSDPAAFAVLLTELMTDSLA